MSKETLFQVKGLDQDALEYLLAQLGNIEMPRVRKQARLQANLVSFSTLS